MELLCCLSTVPKPVDELAEFLGVGPFMVYELAGVLRRRSVDVIATADAVRISAMGRDRAKLMATAYWERTYGR